MWWIQEAKSNVSHRDVSSVIENQGLDVILLKVPSSDVDVKVGCK